MMTTSIAAGLDSARRKAAEVAAKRAAERKEGDAEMDQRRAEEKAINAAVEAMTLDTTGAEIESILRRLVRVERSDTVLPSDTMPTIAERTGVPLDALRAAFRAIEDADPLSIRSRYPAGLRRTATEAA